MKKLVLSIFTAVFLLGASSAQAVPITSWDYDLEYGFFEWTDTAGDSGDLTGNSSAITPSEYNSVPPAEYASPTKLSWGVPHSTGNGEQSYLQVDPGYKSDTYGPPLGDWEPAMTFTHGNNVVTLDSTHLRSTTLYSIFAIRPEGEAGPEDSAFVPFGIEFWETPNADYDNDYFYLVNPGALTSQIVFDGYIYDITFRIEGLEQLDADAVDFFGGATGEVLYGLQTIEASTNTFDVEFKIESTVIPEPTTFLLFGIGLLGCTGIIRRKQMS